ncbi:unnamed protein product [Adineta steineri]|uniref:DUF2252 domain-containing protein n=1 Tax=Adineta steineri TaxID=433720 RepID=A0A815C0U6_9BILA|nr:unnamed protein product [Adineta steineri]CAF3627637.1 unnamed protein product [Adineta steineri]
MPRANSRLRTNNLSYEINASKKAIYRIQSQTDQERSTFIINTFTQFFNDGIKTNPDAFRSRFRKMSATPFNFYRGSAILFYQDLKIDKDPYIEKNHAAGQIFIHGDLHAENFGTYLDSNGVLNFDVNDFDESYLGPFTWDVKRLLASLNIVCYSKGFSDDDIKQVLHVCVETYLKQVKEFCRKSDDHFSLTLQNTSGKIKQLLNETRIKSHVALLNKLTNIENYDRKFIRTKYVQNVDKILYEKLMRAFQQYLDSIPENKKYSDRGFNGGELTYHIKDIVQCSSPGIGSAGKISYSFLLEGRSETLENDIILYLKPAQKSAVSYVVTNEQTETFFQNDGLRTVLCSYAMQASTPRWLGHTTLNSIACMVDAVTAHSIDLDWSDINDLNDILEVVQYLGKATAKIHCIADSDCVNTPKDIECLPFSLIPKNIEKTICDAIAGQENEFIQDMIEFGMIYGELVRRDHYLFFEAFRNNQIPGL